MSVKSLFFMASTIKKPMPRQPKIASMTTVPPKRLPKDRGLLHESNSTYAQPLFFIA